MRNNYTYLVLLVISAAIFAVFICPALKMHNMGWLCYVFYGVVIVVFLFGRTARVKRVGPRS